MRYTDPDGRADKNTTLDWIQGGLDAAGCVPGIGEIADCANGVISLCRGDFLAAGLSFVAMVPIVGDAIGKGGKAANFIAKNGDEIAAGAKRLFWSGFGDGGIIAEQYAKKNGFITLEMTLDNPPSFLENPKFWKDASADFANSAKGDVSALLVSDFSFNYPGANTFKDVEFDILLLNPDVTSINLIW